MEWVTAVLEIYANYTGEILHTHPNPQKHTLQHSLSAG